MWIMSSRGFRVARLLRSSVFWLAEVIFPGTTPTAAQETTDVKAGSTFTNGTNA